MPAQQASPELFPGPLLIARRRGKPLSAGKGYVFSDLGGEGWEALVVMRITEACDAAHCVPHFE